MQKNCLIVQLQKQIILLLNKKEKSLINYFISLKKKY